MILITGAAGFIGSPDFLAEVMQSGPFEIIMHVAAVLNTASRGQPDEALRVNIGSSLTLLHLATQSKVQKFIFGSSISVYGPKLFAEYGAVSEEDPAAPNTIYGVSKRYVELAGQDYHEHGTFQFVAVRIAMVVGLGAVNTSTPWRSQIFERLRDQQSTRIDLSFARPERLPSFMLRMSPKSSNGSSTLTVQSTPPTTHLQKIGQRVIWGSIFTLSTGILR